VFTVTAEPIAGTTNPALVNGRQGNGREVRMLATSTIQPFAGEVLRSKDPPVTVPVKVGLFVIVTLGVVPPEEAMFPEPVTDVTVPEPVPQLEPMEETVVPLDCKQPLGREVLLVPPFAMATGTVKDTVGEFGLGVEIVMPVPAVSDPMEPLGQAVDAEVITPEID